jgi:hypothetical protein
MAQKNSKSAASAVANTWNTASTPGLEQLVAQRPNELPDAVCREIAGGMWEFWLMAMSS